MWACKWKRLAGLVAVTACYTLSLAVYVCLFSVCETPDEYGWLPCSATFALLGLLVPFLVEEINAER